MAYKRRSVWISTPTTTTKVSIHWSNKAGAYSLRFHDTKHWTEMQIFISYLKQQPMDEREYDPENRVWYFAEKHLPPIQEMIKMLVSIFEVDFVLKPIGQTNTSTSVPVEQWINKFKTLTGLDNTERRSYLRWMMLNHPDKPENKDKAKLVSDVHQCWNEIHKKEIIYDLEGDGVCIKES